MRETKFRLWDGESLHYGGFSVHATGVIELSPFLQKAGELMQFTGLQDKNGKDIYEGDIIKTKEYYGYQHSAVEWNGDQWWLSASLIKNSKSFEFEHGQLSNAIEYGNERCEVIGNIYSNKELLSI